MTAKPVKFGIDVLLESKNLEDITIGLVCNATSLSTTGTHASVALLSKGFNVKKLFSPEHGFSAKGDDGAFISDDTDIITKLPIVSLYGEKLAPTANDLADIDLVIVDLPDIGARFYTYLWTMTYVMETCAANGKKLLILDRPNPIAKQFEFAEGPILEENCSSFIGRFPIPIKHNCTLGELARYFKSSQYPSLQLEIEAMKNWDRYENNNYPFFATSPAIQKRHTTYIYPGTCLFEGLNINEARGTEFPFEQFGAPWIDASLLRDKMLENSDVADLEIITFKATVAPYLNDICHGLRIIPKNLHSFKPVAYVIMLISLMARLFPNHLKERNYLTNVNPNGEKHLDKLLGLSNSLEKIITNKIDTNVPNWLNTVKPYLIYP
ncbi:MAG: DUF1343 domain-containing protein [Pedobacter sp.]|uniref:exo-beta-N-acetylmuramidase NamZ family protein n=1 Tax=Pedobacter sp. TaxID=1411316 RepID=UPI00280945C1|nr:DUF1343 domain-containing protein [Pedobacter sp.]MDQ8004086.1 DUF1343 domain-containing protein [Pedobacter sp.]